jgi:hypothetical protein
LALRNPLQLYETRTFLSKQGTTGISQEPFYVVSGSRMLVTLKVIALDVGASVALDIQNSFDQDEGFETVETAQLSATGTVKRILSDFHTLFNLRVNVTGGNATYKVAVSIYDNAVATKIENAQVDVSLDHFTDTLGHFDSTRIGDGEDLWEIDSNGAGHVTLDDADDETPVHPYNEIPSIASGADTDLLTYTVPVGKTAFLYRAEGSGENIARYKVLVNGTPIATRRTHHGSGLTATFDFVTGNKRQVVLQPGDIIKLKVLHNRPSAGDFEARLQLLLKDTP